MPETQKLVINQDYGQIVRHQLWSLINNGWAVKSAIYQIRERRFLIKLAKEMWPEILIPCSTCGTKYPPGLLAFTPRSHELCYCTVCAASKKWSG